MAGISSPGTLMPRIEVDAVLTAPKNLTKVNEMWESSFQALREGGLILVLVPTSEIDRVSLSLEKVSFQKVALIATGLVQGKAVVEPGAVLVFSKYRARKRVMGRHLFMPGATQKDLLRSLLCLATNEGDTVFDPFAADSQVPEACKDEGRIFRAEVPKEYQDTTVTVVGEESAYGVLGLLDQLEQELPL